MYYGQQNGITKPSPEATCHLPLSPRHHAGTSNQIFHGGSDSKEFADYRRKVKSDVTKARGLVQSLPEKIDAKGVGKWSEFVFEIARVGRGHRVGFLVCQLPDFCRR